MSGRRWDGGGGRGIESEEEEAGVGLMSGVHVAVHDEEEESSFGGLGISAAVCGRGGCSGPSTSGVGCASNNHRTSGAKHVLVWNQPELDDLTAADNHNGYSHRPAPAKGIYRTFNTHVFS